MVKKTVVIIARAFPPLNVIATERVIKFVNSFLKEGWNVKVITIDDKDIKEKFLDKERKIKFVNEKNLEIIRTKYSLKESFHIYKSLGNFVFIKKFLGLILFKIGLDDSVGWIPYIYKNIMEINKKDKIDLILATGSPFLPFMVPFMFKRKYRTKYVLDFRDLWFAQPHGKRNLLQKFVIKNFEKVFLNNADMVTTVSYGCKEELEKNTFNKNIKVLYNFPDEDYIKYIKSIENKNIEIKKFNDKFFNIVYTGTLYEGRDLTSIAKAISLLPENIKNQLKFHYFGSRVDIAKNNFKKFNVINNLIIHGVVNKEVSIAALYKADLLISVIHNDVISHNSSVKGIITTKIFDYIIVNKPVINVLPKDSEVRNLLKSINTDLVFNFTSNESEKMKNKILQIFQNYENIKNKKNSLDSLDWHFNFMNVFKGIL